MNSNPPRSKMIQFSIFLLIGLKCRSTIFQFYFIEIFMTDKDQEVAASESSSVGVLIDLDDEDHSQAVKFMLALLQEDAVASSLSDLELVDFPSQAALPVLSQDTRRCCHFCGYKAVYLPSKQTEGGEISLCRECSVYDDPRKTENLEQFSVAWMPNHSKETVSAMSKLLALITVATTEDQLLERYTAPDSGLFITAVDGMFERGRAAFPDVTTLLQFISKHCAIVANEITAGFKKAVVDAREIFGTNSLREFLRLYDLSDAEARTMMDSGVRFIPQFVSKDQTGKQQVAHFLRDIISALSNGTPAFTGASGPEIDTGFEVVQKKKGADQGSTVPERVQDLQTSAISGLGTVPAPDANQDGEAQ